jgi:glycosyltransferase involved in cell wall biosynthesis
VLEAMAMARPVVASPEALEGIDAKIDEEVIKADGVTEFVNKTLKLLDDKNGDPIGDRARLRVVKDYGWSANLKGLKTLLEDARLN